MQFHIGQRWISHAESTLGLGIISQIDGRQISLSFPACGELRMYAADTAPLSRIIYKEGDEILTLDQQKLKVDSFEEYKGILIYQASDELGMFHSIVESELSGFINLNSPQQRLFSSQIDKLSSFKLRIDSLNHLSRLQQSQVRGLLGSRTSHLPHQVYIANEVAQRYAPRVLLADEVGLGKTIEAGMIIHYQLHTGRADRVLIIVPQNLIHQWFVEMLRRFNLHFTILDQNRYEELQAKEDINQYIDEESEEEQENPTPAIETMFSSEPLILCSLELLMEQESLQEEVLAADWGLLVVDEAHHLQGLEEKISPEYQLIEQLAAKSKGLLLLTATPEQLGIESHFARLRLLDPARFYDFERFKQEEQSYQPLNSLIQQLISYPENISTDTLTPQLKTQLSDLLGPQDVYARDNTIKALLDRHGTGRLLFRNTRAAIQGFPERKLHGYPLAEPELYQSLESTANQLYPETTVANGEWLATDPRVEWLENKLKNLYPEKVLVICAKANTAVTLEQYFRPRSLRSAAFHEGLSIIERDRAAAYFSEEDKGAQALICSEIGSEGRNFQFAHHLVLFDLPLNPDLLEQRIGRLDRIGQRQQIEIHVPYLQNTAQEILFRWYQEGINLFEQSCASAFAIYQVFEQTLHALLEQPKALHSEEQLKKLIVKTKDYTEKTRLALQEGRDQLLEMNSCHKPSADNLIAAIEAEESSLQLGEYMAKIFHEFGIDHDYHSENCEILRPSAQMHANYFPGVKEEGTTITYSRTKALVREDMEFLSWEHPIVCEAMEMVLGSELGNACLATISIKGLNPGTLFLETFYTLNYIAPKSLQLERFLPLTPIRILIDTTGKDFSALLTYERLNNLCEKIQRHKAQAIVKEVRSAIEQMLEKTNHLAETQMQTLLIQAKKQMQDKLNQEIVRLEALQKINPSIREEELNYFKEQRTLSEEFINQASLKLQAVRVTVNK